MALSRSRRTRRTRGEIRVTVLRAGGTPQAVELEEGATVQDAIDEAGFTVKDGDEVVVAGEVVDNSELEETTLQDDDQIVIGGRYQGGN